MTALCGGGTSSARPGVGQTNVVAGGLITEGLTAISLWLLPFAALVDGFVFQATSQCSSDPPAQPVFNSSDITNLIGGVLNPNVSVTLAKINDALLNWVWPRFCQCDTVPTPAVQPIPPPAGVGQVTGSPSQPCFAGASNLLPPYGNSGYESGWSDATNGSLPTDGMARHTLTDPGGNYTVYAIPPGVTSLVYTGVIPYSTACGPNDPFAGFGFSLYDSSFNLLNSSTRDLQDWVSNSGVAGARAVPANAAWWRMIAFNNSSPCGGIPAQLQLATQIWCGGGGPSVLSSCCPTDPAITIGIQNILKVVQNLNNSSSGPPPTSWSDGVTHAGLANHGSITLAGHATGVRVTMTTLPSGVQVDPGTPTFYWDAGFITPLELGSPLRGARLVFTPQTFALPQFTDSIGYTLKNGTVISITELIPL